MPEKRNKCQEVPLVWRKMLSTLLSSRSRHLQPNFMDHMVSTISRTRRDTPLTH